MPFPAPLAQMVPSFPRWLVWHLTLFSPIELSIASVCSSHLPLETPKDSLRTTSSPHVPDPVLTGHSSPSPKLETRLVPFPTKDPRCIEI